MHWRRQFERVSHVFRGHGICIAGAVAFLGYIIYEKKQKGIVYASWTTNFEPSVKWDNNWDRRDPEFLVKPLNESATDDEKEEREKNKAKVTPTSTRHILMIRHGQYYDNAKEDEARILTLLGRDQAELTGKRLLEMNLPFTKIISSTMTRAIETSHIIHKFLPHLALEQTDMLREGAPIPPEPPIGGWRPEKNFYQDGARIEAAFRKFFHRADAKQTSDSYEILVCHANVIRYFICRALQLPPEAWLRLSLNHGSITWITIRPSGRVSLMFLGESGYMPIEKISRM
ncbi:hypothetical protein ACJMK2_011870 [Sinanodonta woodiana]|uniref:Serine/threonine-protein phosphatase PGAM5, mitochondrial n=1 Tax=Sinanodonta woodiana TaxID=1069815 RepID=A0ABD3V6E5_SINWO